MDDDEYVEDEWDDWDVDYDAPELKAIFGLDPFLDATIKLSEVEKMLKKLRKQEEVR